MNVFSLCGFGICAVCVAVILKQTGNGFQPMMAAAAGAVMLGYITIQTVPVLQFVKSLAEETGISEYFALAVKSLGVALVCQLSAEICRDFGETAIAGRIELAGKTAIIVMSLPVLKNLMTFVRDML